MLQLLLGNVGRPGGGVNALRGHSNIQGATDTAGTFEILPGYLKTPAGPAADARRSTCETATPTTLNKQAWASMNYWSNYPKFMVSLLKSAYGKNATKENDFGYEWLPKVDGNYSWMYIFDDMYRGNSSRVGGKEPGPEGLITFGMNPVGIGPNAGQDDRGALEAQVARRRRDLRHRDRHVLEGAQGIRRSRSPRRSQTEVYQLPCTGFAEKDGTFTNSARWLQWKWKAIDPPGQARNDQEVLARIFLAVRDLYKKEGGALPEQVLNVNWSYTNPASPDLGEVLKEINGKALADIPDPKDKTKMLKTAGQQLDGFGQLQDDGTTACGNWLHSGVFTEAGNNAQRRSTADPTGLGMFHNWGFSWPANRRIMYNRASADAQGKAWDPDAPGNRVERREVGRRRSRHQARLAAGRVRRLHHERGGRRPSLRRGPERRAVPGALRADRGAGRQPAAPEGHVEPRREEVHLQQGRLRHAQGFPDRRARRTG